MAIDSGNPNPQINPAIESVRISDQESQRKRMQTTADLVFGLTISVSSTVIIAAITNRKKLDSSSSSSSSSSRVEHILYEASAGFALLCLFAGVGLLISVLAPKAIRRTQLGLQALAVASIIVSVVLLALRALI